MSFNPDGYIPACEALCRVCETLWPNSIIARGPDGTFAGGDPAVDYEFARDKLTRVLTERTGPGFGARLELFVEVRGQRCAILPDELRAIDPDNYLLSSTIAAFLNQKVAKYHGGAAYLDRAKFQAWLSDLISRRDPLGAETQAEIGTVNLEPTKAASVADNSAPRGPAAAEKSKRNRVSPQHDKAAVVVLRLWPNGVPSHGELPNKKLCDAARAEANDNTLSDTTILRAAGRKKSQLA